MPARRSRGRGVAVFALAVVVALVASACSGGSAGSGRSRGSRGSSSAPLRWTACGAAGTDCATLVVPLDRAVPRGATVRLALFRHRAEGRRVGALLVNPGGPGAPGRFLAEHAGQLFPSAVRDAFDIVAWDARGVGASTAVHCGEHLDAFYAIPRPPRTAAEVQANVTAARALAAACTRGSGALLAHVSTDDTVADMDAIRAALAERTLTYLGFSYGTFLGTRYAVTHPTRVRAMVLDGAIDPSVGIAESTVQQSAGFDDDLAAFLRDCSARRSCAFHSGGDAAGALRRLLAQIAAEPEFARVDGETRSVGSTLAGVAIATALYAGRSAWPQLAGALAAAAAGDASALATLADSYTERGPGGVYSTSQEAFYAISCADGQDPTSLAAVEQVARAARVRAPFLGELNAWLGLPCAYWPVHAVAHAAPVQAPASLPTVVVVSSTHDPATPYAWGVSLARQLRARLVSVDADAHTAFLTSGACVQQPIIDYLITAEPPRADVSC